MSPPASETALVLSHYQATPLLRARSAGAQHASASPDLGLSTVDVLLDDDGVRFPNGLTTAWADLQRIADELNACFLVSREDIAPIRVFSETTNWLRSLYPTTGAPTMLVSVIPMHRIQGPEPHADTLRKMQALKPL